jgi:hypothetical protein
MLIGVVYLLNYRLEAHFLWFTLYRRSHLLLDWRATLREEWNQSPQFVGEPGVVLPFCWWAAIWNKFHFSILCTYIIYIHIYVFLKLYWCILMCAWCCENHTAYMFDSWASVCAPYWDPQWRRILLHKVAQSWKLSQLGSFHIFINCMEKNCGSTVPHGLHRSPT